MVGALAPYSAAFIKKCSKLSRGPYFFSLVPVANIRGFKYRQVSQGMRLLLKSNCRGYYYGNCGLKCNNHFHDFFQKYNIVSFKKKSRENKRLFLRRRVRIWTSGRAFLTNATSIQSVIIFGSKCINKFHSGDTQKKKKNG